jgi:hypothetical protein
MAVSEDREVLQSEVLASGGVGDAILMQENDSVGEAAPELAVLLRPSAAELASAASA